MADVARTGPARGGTESGMMSGVTAAVHRPAVIVPALTPSGWPATGRAGLGEYVRRAADTWIDAFLLSGSTTRGDLLSTTDRAELIDVWLQHLPPHRLIACCWHPDDVTAATARGVAPMVVMRGLPDRRAALEFLAELPAGGLVYSHPMYSPTVFDAELATAARGAGVLPAGGKFAKVSLDQGAALRAATGSGFALWDGRCRHVAASAAAGAAGVIATPLSHLPKPFPSPELSHLQAALDGYQAALDALPGRPERTLMLQRAAFGD